jgi:ankyrin repeat protein
MNNFVKLCYDSRENYNTIKTLLENKEDVNQKNIDGNTGLMMVIRHTCNYDISIETIELLLKHGANVNLKNNDGRTALMTIITSESIKPNFIDIIRLLLKYKANVNLWDNFGMRALGFAIQAPWNSPQVKYSSQVIELLLEHADIKYQNHDILLRAIKQGNEETCKLLVKYGYNTNIKLETSNKRWIELYNKIIEYKIDYYTRILLPMTTKYKLPKDMTNEIIKNI